MTQPDEADRGRSAKSIVVSVLKVVVSAGLLWLLFSRVDVARLWSAARQASPAWLAGALLLYFIMILASAVRWDALLRAQHVRLPFSFLTQSFLVATFFNNFLPGNIGGGPDRPSTYCAVIVKTVDERTRSKTSINELLRD